MPIEKVFYLTKLTFSSDVFGEMFPNASTKNGESKNYIK